MHIHAYTLTCTYTATYSNAKAIKGLAMTAPKPQKRHGRQEVPTLARGGGSSCDFTTVTLPQYGLEWEFKFI